VEVPIKIVHTVGADSQLQFPERTIREAHINLAGVHLMNVDLALLKNLLSKRSAEIEKSVAGSGYLVRTVIGVGTFLLDNEGDIDLLSAKQKITFEKFILPLLDVPRR
jgi:hypothetical protein